MNDIIPLFYSESSQKSILSWISEKDYKIGGPQSIIKLAKQGNLDKVYFVSSKFYDFITAWKLCEENNLQLIFGLELWVCPDLFDRSDISSANESKVIIWMKNSSAYKDLIKLYSSVHTEQNNKYYHFRASWSLLKLFWTDNLLLSIPFFDSFYSRNMLNYNSSILADLPAKPLFFREVDSGLPFAHLVEQSLITFIQNSYEVMDCKTIYYEKYDDAKQWMIYRSIKERNTFNKPNLDFCCSNRFCFQNYLEIISK
jgi:DNA polymerase III alpha subunit